MTVDTSLVPARHARPLLPYFAVAVGTLAASSASIMIKLSAAPALVLAFYRLAMTEAIFLPAALVTNPRDITRMSGRDFALAALSGVFLALHFFFWITSLRYTSVASSLVLVDSHPLFVMAGGYFFYREHLPGRAVAGAVLALAGTVVVGANDFRVGGTALYGDLLAWLGAATVAAYFLVGRGVRQRVNLLPYTLVVYGSAALVLMTAALVSRVPLYPYPPAEYLIFLGLALGPTILGHTSYNWALKYLKTSVVSITILAEPVLSSLLAMLLFKEVPSVWLVIGGSVILIGIGMFVLNSGDGR